MRSFHTPADMQWCHLVALFVLCPCLQRWRTLGPEKVALFAACNLPWLDFKFELAPKAGLNTGALLPRVCSACTLHSNPLGQGQLGRQACKFTVCCVLCLTLCCSVLQP